MKIKFLFLITCFSFFSIVAQEQKMTTSEVKQFKGTISTATQNIKSIVTDFTQFKHMEFLSNDIETSGKMYFKAPNMLNWQYTKPYSYSIVFKNNKVYINDQGKKSSFDANNKMFEKINKLIVGSVSGDMFDETEFTIEYFKEKDTKIVKLTPKTTTLKKYIKQVHLYFLKNEATVSKVKLIENSNDYTLIVFKNKQINAKVTDSMFAN